MKWLSAVAALTFAAIPLSQSLAAPVAAAPYPSDAMIEGAKLCTRHLPRYEREYAIPTHLLSAIATTESGRYHEGLGMKLPWPWAINAGGKGYFFDTKEQAIAAVRKLRARGVQSIDVGCMQVNIYQHPHAFSSLSEAFEPQSNIAYAASFLRNLYDEGGSWKKAAANYHSRTPSLGSGYVSQVYDSWYTIIDKLRAARLQVPESSVVAMNELKQPYTVSSHTTHTATNTAPHVIHIASVESHARSSAPVHGYAHEHMNSVRVTSESEADNEDYGRRNTSIIVVPDHSAAAAQTAPAYAAPAQAVPAVIARADAPLNAAPQPVALAQVPVSNVAVDQTAVSGVAVAQAPVMNAAVMNAAVSNAAAAQAPVATQPVAQLPVANATVQVPVPAGLTQPVNALASAVGTAASTYAAEIKTADNITPQQTPMPIQQPAQTTLVLDPTTGHATNGAMSDLSPAAGTPVGVRHVLEFSPDHSGPRFIFND